MRAPQGEASSPEPAERAPTVLAARPSPSRLNERPSRAERVARSAPRRSARINAAKPGTAIRRTAAQGPAQTLLRMDKRTPMLVLEAGIPTCNEFKLLEPALF
jgi:hypothetical protein